VNENHTLNTVNGKGFIGTTLSGKYRIESLLGSGGMGSVYKAHHLAFDKAVAIKILHIGLDGDSTSLERFKREALALERLCHPNIVGFYAFDLSDGRPYAVIEFLQGETLNEVLLNRGSLEESQCISIFCQILDAVEAAHEKAIIHRDLKPSNVLLVQSPDALPPQVKVLDFGLSKIVEPQAGAQNVTRTGVLLGTPLYMSPEQCLGKPATAASDIYSIGCMLYECLSGKPPFNGDSPYAVLMQHISEPPPTITTPEGRHVAMELEALVHVALSKQPEQRFQTAREFKAALSGLTRLERIGGAEPKQSKHVKEKRYSPRRFKLMSSMVAVIIALVAAIAFMVFQRPQTTSPLVLAQQAVTACGNRNYQAAHSYLSRALPSDGSKPTQEVFNHLKKCNGQLLNRYGKMPDSGEPVSIVAFLDWLAAKYVELGPVMHEEEYDVMKNCSLLAKRAAIPRTEYQGTYLGGDVETAEKYLIKALELANNQRKSVSTDDWIAFSNIAKNTADLFREKMKAESDPQKREVYKRRYQNMVKIKAQNWNKTLH